MLKRDKIIVLRLDDFMESSYIITALTENNGLLKFVAKGAKRLKSPLRMAMDLFSLSEVVFYFIQDREFNTIKEGKIMERFPGIAEDLVKYDLVSRISRYIINKVPMGAGEYLFREMLEFLEFVNNKDKINPLLFDYFILRFLSKQGELPRFDLCSKCGSRDDLFYLPSSNSVLCSKCIGEEVTGSIGIDMGFSAEVNFIISRTWEEINNLRLRAKTQRLLSYIEREK